MPSANPITEPALPGPSGEARAFMRMRGRILRSRCWQWLRTGRLRSLVIVLMSGVLWGGMLYLFFEGFELLQWAVADPASRAKTVHIMFNVFFLSLLAMLTVSSSIIFYSTVYRSEEVGMLLTLPVRATRVVIHKWQETALFSCWGFLLLGSPMLLAYGSTVGAPWWYYLLLLPFMIAFAMIPAAAGVVLCLLVVYFLPRLRAAAAVIGGVLLAGLALLVGWSVMQGSSHDMMTPYWLRDTLARLQFSEQRLLPSWWLSSGLLEAAHPAVDDGSRRAILQCVGYLCVLVANALLGQWLVAGAGGRLLRPGYSALQGLLPSARRASLAALDRWVAQLLRPFSRPMRLLLLKDIRLFRRDPVQWSQFMIFLGLLVLYFLNIRRFQYGDPMLGWVNAVGFLNLAVVGLILATFTTRFVFPMISLEGRRFWILGTLPVSREEILWGKLAYALAGSLLPCSFLILVSDFMLQIVQRTPLVALLHQLTCLQMCLGLSALAVGLGARLPVLRETSPARVAAGFGGTLNLVIGTGYIVTIVALTAWPCYFWLTDVTPPGELSRQLGLGTARPVWLGVAVSILVCVAMTLVPLRLGLRAFRRLEF